MYRGSDPMLMMFVTFLGVFTAIMGGAMLGGIIGTLTVSWLGWVVGLTVSIGGTALVYRAMASLLK